MSACDRCGLEPATAASVDISPPEHAGPTPSSSNPQRYPQPVDSKAASPSRARVEIEGGNNAWQLVWVEGE